LGALQILLKQREELVGRGFGVEGEISFVGEQFIDAEGRKESADE